MPNHPNRSRRKDAPARNPSPDEIRDARHGAGLTQAQAAGMIHCTQKAWIKWESAERRMHPAFWELYGIKQGGRNNKNFKSLYYALQLSDSDVVEILGGSVSKSRVKGWLRGQNASRDRGHGRETRFTPMSDEEFDLFCSRLEDWLDAEESA